MGKRKHKDKRSHGKKKRRREKRPRYYESDSSSSSSEEDNYEVDRYRYSDPYNTHSYTPDYECNFSLPDSDDSVTAHNTSAVEINGAEQAISSDKGGEVYTSKEPQSYPNTGMNPTGDPVPMADPCLSGAPTLSTAIGPNAGAVMDNPLPGTSVETSTLPAEILEALGDPKGKEEVFGPKIPEEIAKRWGRVLLDGLTKELKQEITEKSLIPDNFRLAKAPLLNPELIPVMSESARNRDKVLEKSQNQLGLGIAKLTKLATTVIEGNLDKIEILKKISEASQIFLDLHHEDTKRRRKLVTSCLDKRFLNMITDVKRDTYLFGVNLAEKIKASKTAERSGLQIKRNDGTMSTFRKYPHQGNWRGPPRTAAQRGYRQGGQRNRYPPQSNRRPPPSTPVSDRQPRATARPTTKTAKS